MELVAVGRWVQKALRCYTSILLPNDQEISAVSDWTSSDCAGNTLTKVKVECTTNNCQGFLWAWFQRHTFNKIHPFAELASYLLPEIINTTFMSFT